MNISFAYGSLSSDRVEGRKSACHSEAERRREVNGRKRRSKPREGASYSPLLVLLGFEGMDHLGHVAAGNGLVDAEFVGLVSGAAIGAEEKIHER